MRSPHTSEPFCAHRARHVLPRCEGGTTGESPRTAARKRRAGRMASTRTEDCGDIIELDRIVKQYGDNTVLDNISLSIGTGEVVSILGPSGCGKTTLLNVLLGITDATDGRIVCDGEDITNVPMEKRGFNIVFQDYALFPNLNAYENVTYGLRNNPGISSQEEVDELVELLGLREHLTKKISQLSGGQKQRVALARTLVMKPRLLLLDEPLSALDGVIKESIKQKIKQIVEQYQLTTVMVTHNPEEALILNGGHIAQYATPDEIVNAPASQFVQDFILRQLTIKRDNIFALFGAMASAGERAA